jgi:hypothetical protein
MSYFCNMISIPHVLTFDDFKELSFEDTYSLLLKHKDEERTILSLYPPTNDFSLFVLEKGFKIKTKMLMHENKFENNSNLRWVYLETS